MYTISIPKPFIHRHSKETKDKAIAMRRQGCSYREILKEVSVAKSTLSLWLREVGLLKPQVQRLTEKRMAAVRKGGAVKHAQAVERRNYIYTESAKSIGQLSDREMWLFATALYWAEGGKEKAHKSGAKFEFSNTDPRMLRAFMYWLLYIEDIGLDKMTFEIYIHSNSKHKIEKVREFWSKELGVPLEKLATVRYKTHKIRTNRKNIGDLYNGLIRVRVTSSSTLVRQVEGWVQGIDALIKKRISIDSKED